MWPLPAQQLMVAYERHESVSRGASPSLKRTRFAAMSPPGFRAQFVTFGVRAIIGGPADNI